MTMKDDTGMGRVGKARAPRQPLFIPDADPQEASADRWFAATGFAPVETPAAADRRIDPTAALENAAALTQKADALAGGDAGAQSKAASLHVLAAELRREAGEWTLCAGNYEAVTRHYLARREHKTAWAYLSRMMFVADASQTPKLQIRAHLLASDVYRDARDFGSAMASARRAAILAARSSDFGALSRTATCASAIRAAAAVPPEAGAACKCGGPLPCAECRKGADHAPAEFLIRAVGVESTPSRPASSPWWSAGQQGIDRVMELPGPSGETPYWVAYGIDDGRHSLFALPNWSARAMRSARAMHAYSVDHGDGFEGPSSAILQVTCALESFINTVIHFMGQDDGARFRGGRHAKRILDAAGDSTAKVRKDKAPGHVTDADKQEEAARRKARSLGQILDGSKHRYAGSLAEKWTVVGECLFGEDWLELNRIEDLRLMLSLRSALAHFKEDNIEQIAPPASAPHPLIAEFEIHPDFQGGNAMRPGPMPWIDRLLTPHLADWAVTLGEDLIAGFRASWQAETEAFERDLQADDHEEDLSEAAAA